MKRAWHWLIELLFPGVHDYHQRNREVFGDKLHEAEKREHRHSGDDPEHPPFTNEEGEFDPGD